MRNVLCMVAFCGSSGGVEGRKGRVSLLWLASHPFQPCLLIGCRIKESRREVTAVSILRFLVTRTPRVCWPGCFTASSTNGFHPQFPRRSRRREDLTTNEDNGEPNRRADWRTRTWRNPTSTLRLGSHRRSFVYTLRGIHRLPQPSSRHFDVMQSRGGVYAISFHVPGKHKSVRASVVQSGTCEFSWRDFSGRYPKVSNRKGYHNRNEENQQLHLEITQG
ncbi:hypothetical protein B0T13DRAFT_518742 [Neurospora crassa]|nr:hypothetical protein B0T13DRAFT_518742 [Neurospora crassa]